MTREDFIKILKDNQIDTNLVSFDDDAKEGYCIRKYIYSWQTLYRERGIEYDVLGFPSESDALKSMLKELMFYRKHDN